VLIFKFDEKRVKNKHPDYIKDVWLCFVF
jgi:hypothetical protein